jgi:hypothetical protein
MRLLIALIAVSCASSPTPHAPAQPAQARASADELFASGRYGDALVAYRNEVKRGDRVAELQTMVVVTQLALAPGAELVDDLRTIEQDYPSSRWGRLAGVIASEIDRGTVLRQAVMAAGAELSVANAAIKDRDARLATLTTQTTDQQTLITSLKDERAHLQAQVKELEESETAKDARIHELEAELLALKQIDMERQP